MELGWILDDFGRFSLMFLGVMMALWLYRRMQTEL